MSQFSSIDSTRTFQLPTMAGNGFLDLTLNDDVEAVDLIRQDGDTQPRRPAQNEIRGEIVQHPPRPLTVPSTSHRKRPAAIDLTSEGRATSLTGAPRREPDLAPTNGSLPDSWSRNQNTTTALETRIGGSSMSHTQVSGGTSPRSVTPSLSRVSAKAAPGTRNTESPTMFPIGGAHRPGNPHARRIWGVAEATTTTRPPPSADGPMPAIQPIVVSSDDDDDDVEIDEEKSTPVNATKVASRNRSIHRHVNASAVLDVSDRQAYASAFFLTRLILQKQARARAREVDRESKSTGGPGNNPVTEEDQLEAYEPAIRELARIIKRTWGLFPWEVDVQVPQQFQKTTFVHSLYDLAEAGHSLERAKQIVDHLFNKSGLPPPESPSSQHPQSPDKENNTPPDQTVEEVRRRFLEAR